ncbi:DUF7009 family protein [Adhaeribacter rhizoryzae]|uniref:Uncharacterized protein n=1 Tax=Adhaeribacter rhizoryzae TaxID=2607907 RepID=A0A5M6DAL3_9BACT|nr:hypothetical protein [Adhaeribacter rhizoryzae]KAA5543332.1 hypothetical protein F0145_16940 [Adhaeribacter rhizoryzae]
MKLRIQGNSLRVRVSETEVAKFREIGHLEESVVFGPTQKETLNYLLIKSYENTEVTASFSENNITISVPAAIAKDWANSEHNGFEVKLPNGTDKGLKILVEKDLDCIH